MKKILESKFILVVTVVLLTLTVDVIADTILKSESISYSNNKTTETTVNGALDELFSAVDINNRLGDTSKISSISDGTIVGAITSQQSEINKQSNELLNTAKIYTKGYYHYNTENNVFEFSTSNAVIMYGARGNCGFMVLIAPHSNEYFILHNTNDLLKINSYEYNYENGKHVINFSLGQGTGTGIWVGVLG